MKIRNLADSAIVHRSKLFCEYCNVDLLSHPRLFESFVLDHLKPRSLGGPNTIENLHIVCAACDRIKRDFPAETIEEAREFLQRFRANYEIWYRHYKEMFRPQEEPAASNPATSNPIFRNLNGVDRSTHSEGWRG